MEGSVPFLRFLYVPSRNFWGMIPVRGNIRYLTLQSMMKHFKVYNIGHVSSISAKLVTNKTLMYELEVDVSTLLQQA